MTPIERLRAAIMVDPCQKHKEECPIPKKGRKKPCQWGHTAMEFAERCDLCAMIVLATLKPKLYAYAQRVHHQKERAAR